MSATDGGDLHHALQSFALGMPADLSSTETVARQLRQEAGFGCARCGHPYIEYHHIIPYAEEPHDRPEDMVALCGNCHPALGKLGRDLQYEIKQAPHNIRKGMLNGALEFDKRNLVFKVGGNWFEDTPTIIQICNVPIVSCCVTDGQAKVSLNLLDQAGRPMLIVSENNVTFRMDDIWDFEYAHNYAVARYAIAEVGQVPPASNHIPPRMKLVTHEQWRAYAWQRGISGSESERAKRQAFQRAGEGLIAKGRVGCWEPYVWII